MFYYELKVREINGCVYSDIVKAANLDEARKAIAKRYSSERVTCIDLIEVPLEKSIGEDLYSQRDDAIETSKRRFAKDNIKRFEEKRDYEEVGVLKKWQYLGTPVVIEDIIQENNIDQAAIGGFVIVVAAFIGICFCLRQILGLPEITANAVYPYMAGIIVSSYIYILGCDLVYKPGLYRNQSGIPILYLIGGLPLLPIIAFYRALAGVSRASYRRDSQIDSLFRHYTGVALIPYLSAGVLWFIAPEAAYPLYIAFAGVFSFFCGLYLIIEYFTKGGPLHIPENYPAYYKMIFWGLIIFSLIPMLIIVLFLFCSGMGGRKKESKN